MAPLHTVKDLNLLFLLKVDLCTVDTVEHGVTLQPVSHNFNWKQPVLWLLLVSPLKPCLACARVFVDSTESFACVCTQCNHATENEHNSHSRVV